MTDDLEFTCSMDGYVAITGKMIELALVALSLVKETYAAILPTELSKAIKYAWKGLTNAGSWAGFGVAALYYFGLEYGYAEYLCQASEYGAIVIEALQGLIDFAG